MRKSKIYLFSIIIFSLLLGFLATPSADAVEDFSGYWSGDVAKSKKEQQLELFLLQITQNWKHCEWNAFQSTEMGHVPANNMLR